MTLGYGGVAHLRIADDDLVVYSYSCYNWCDPDCELHKKTEDGEIYIERNSFIEPEIHEKLKRMPSGRKKLIVKRVPNDVPYEDYIKSGIIKYKNASNTWRTYLGVDVIALSIIRKIYYDYQETGEIPKVISCFK